MSHEVQPLIVDGQRIVTSKFVALTSPWNGQSVGSVSLASISEVELALQTAHAGRARLASLSSGARRKVLTELARAVERNADRFVALIRDEAGKPLTAAKAEVARGIETLTLAAGAIASFGSEAVPVDFMPGAEGTEAEVRRFPAGVIVGIVPFNFPLNLGLHKVAPALAIGAPIIIKPPPQAPSAMLLLGQLALEAGADPAALQVIACDNELAEKLATDERVRVVSFTGSAKVGWHLKTRTRAKVVLELGGNAAAIVAKDAQLPAAAKRLATGAFVYAGQVCIKVQRIFVEAPVWSAFTELFLKEVDSLPVGDPSRADVVVGPVIDARSADRIEAWVNEAVAKGAKVLRRGARQGQVIPPCVLTNVDSALPVVAEEVFGPVVILESVPDVREAMNHVNASQYGLQASVFTESVRTIREAFHGLEVGGVIVNDSPSFRSDNMPYGGVKGSGVGREGVRATMLDYSEERVLVTRP